MRKLVTTITTAPRLLQHQKLARTHEDVVLVVPVVLVWVIGRRELLENEGKGQIEHRRCPFFFLRCPHVHTPHKPTPHKHR